MDVQTNDTYEYDNDSPRPVDAESVARGAFGHLEEGQGAVVAGRRGDGASHMAEPVAEAMDRHTVVLIVVGMLVAMVLVVAFVIGTLASTKPAEPEPQTVEQTVADKDKGVELRGHSYKVQEQDGKYVLVEESEASGSKPVTLGELPGTPAGLVLYDGALIMPENLKDGTWDIMAYTIGSGWSQLMNQKGKVTSGKGEVSAVELNDTTLVLTVGSKKVEVPLVW